MWTERSQNGWLLLELTIVIFFLLTIIDVLWVKLKNYMEPTGFNIENTFVLKLKAVEPIAADYVQPEDITETPAEELQKLVSRISLYPDIETVAPAFYAAPYPHGGWWDRLSADSVFTGDLMGRNVTPAYFTIFQIPFEAGKLEETQGSGYRSIIISRDVAEKLYGSATNAVGKAIHLGDILEDEGLPARVVAVTSLQKRQDFDPYTGCFFELLSSIDMNRLKSDFIANATDICIRVKPGSAKHFEESFEADMGEQLRINNLYIASVTSGDTLKDNIVGVIIRQSLQQMMYVILFVLITVFLGVLGAFWLRTTRRTGEIGIRMAIGASSKTIRWQMMLEGFGLILVATIPALIVYVNLLIAEALDTWRLPVSAERVVIVLSASLLLTVAMVAGGIWWPASRASKTQLAEALRDE